MAVVMITGVAAVPVTAGAPVGVKSTAHEEDSEVKITVKITPDNAKNGRFDASVMRIGARDSGGGGNRILLLIQFHHEQCEDKLK